MLLPQSALAAHSKVPCTPATSALSPLPDSPSGLSRMCKPHGTVQATPAQHAPYATAKSTAHILPSMQTQQGRCLHSPSERPLPQACNQTSAHHVALCHSKVHPTPAQLGALLCIMSPPVWSRVAHIVWRRGGGLEAEVAQEGAAISLPSEVGVDIRLAVRAAQGPRLPKVSHLQMSRGIPGVMCGAESVSSLSHISLWSST